MDFPGFVGSNYETLAVTNDAERTVNFYFERMESPGAASRSALYPTPGVNTISLSLPSLGVPGTPDIIVVGAAGATTYGYKVVAVLGDGTSHSVASAEGTTTTGNATLTVVNFNRVSWANTTNARTFLVYRTTGGASPPVRIGTTGGLSFEDIGYVGVSETPASTNTAGGAFTGPGPGRAHFFEADRGYAVIGALFGEYIEAGIFTPYGVVSTALNIPATISSNGSGGGELFITSGLNGYIFDVLSLAFTQITSLDGTAWMGDQLDGYFLALDAVSSTMRISNLEDGLTWDPTQFAQRSSSPDPWRSMRVNGIYIWLFGDETSEVWYDTGESPFPFARHPSGQVPYGIAAPFSSAVGDGRITWLGASKTGDGFVLSATGFTPDVVSDYPLQLRFNQYARINDAQADMMNYLGHSQYFLTFPTVDVTWCWDARENRWTEIGTWVDEQSRYTAWRPRWHAMAFGEHRMLDSSTGSLYQLDQTQSLDVDGRVIRRLREAPDLTEGNQRIYYASFELDLEPGLGAQAGQGENPMAMLQISNDGGKTWGAEMWRSAGALGKYLTRLIWNRLGAARRRVFRLVVSDPVPWRVTGAYLTLAQPIKSDSRQPQQSA